MNEELADFIDELVSRSLIFSDVVAINQIVDEAAERFPAAPPHKVARLALRSVFAAGARAVWEDSAIQPFCIRH